MPLSLDAENKGPWWEMIQGPHVGGPKASATPFEDAATCWQIARFALQGNEENLDRLSAEATR